CSWVSRWANSPCSASSPSASLTSSAARCRSGVADQAGKAAFAAATACSSWARSARGAAVRVRPVAGLITSRAPAPGTSLPSINNLKLGMTYPSLGVLVVCRLTDRSGRVIPRPSASATAARRRGSEDRRDEPTVAHADVVVTEPRPVNDRRGQPAGAHGSTSSESARAELVVALRAGPFERPSPSGRGRRPALLVGNGKGVCVAASWRGLRLFGGSSARPELLRRDADQAPEVMAEVALV